jgi:regulator of sirC expression with transglutaminase-like and TPR domain
MRILESSPSGVSLPENQRAALISLLADDDPAVYQLVRAKILSYGEAACDWLRPEVLSSDPKMRRRAQEILTHHARRKSDAKFLEFCRRQGEDLDLEEGVGLLAQAKYPEMNREAYSALFDSWAESIRSLIRSRSTAQETLGAMNSFLFEELGFEGSDQVGYQADCCYVNRIVDDRKGNPIGLCAVYLFIARRLRLPIAGIGLPGHFVCRYQSSTQEFYIDCFRKGIFLTKADCVKFLLNASYGMSEGNLSPFSPRKTLHRMCNNLVVTYGHLELTEEAARAQRYVAALAR